MNKRVILMILDSLGVGALPDSEKYGDVGVNTLNNIAKNVDRFEIPNLIKMGIGNLEGITHVPASDEVIGAYGRSMEVSNGKDTTMGHWEIAGLNISEPFNTYPDGFPDEIIKPFEEKTGRKVVCNAPASGTVVIDEYGKHHMETVAKNDTTVVKITKEVYPEIASKHDTTPSSVERAIRHAIDLTLARGSVALIESYFKHELFNNKITNKEFILGIVDNVRHR